MKILKFGGTSMGSSENIIQVANILIKTSKKHPVIAVVSAMSQTTNMLEKLTKTKDKNKIKEIIKEIENKHYHTLKNIVWREVIENSWEKNFKNIFEELEKLLKSFYWNINNQNIANVMFFGERLSSVILREATIFFNKDSININSNEIIKTDSNYLNASVNFQETEKICKKRIKNIDLGKTIPIITGFAGSDEINNTTLLWRWWSDYVATILWWATNADSIEIRTDVDWIHSADPRKIKNTKIREKLDYRICIELALAWAKVLHPKTIAPAMQKNITVKIKNTFKPKINWTEISSFKDDWIKWINMNNEQILIHFTDTKMFGAIWYINKITNIFLKYNIVIDSFATSEVSFTCSVCKKNISDNLLIDLKEASHVKIIDNVSKISIVWENMWKEKILQKTFILLENEEIFLVSKWASSKNITLFVNKDKGDKILVKLHEAFFE